MKRQIDVLVDLGKMRPSNYEYACRVTLPVKKDGRRHFCGDYRPLNTQTRQDSFPMPLVEDVICRNPSFGLATKAKGLQGCGPKGSPGVTSGIPGSVRKCEGVNPHTPKATPALGDGVPVDSRNFRDQFEGSNLNGLWRSLYQWKALEA